MKKNKWILAVIALLLAAGGYYGYTFYYAKNKDIAGVKPKAIVEARVLLNEFQSDEMQATRKYITKDEMVIEITGISRELKTDDRGNSTLVISGDESDMSSIQCAVDSAHRRDFTGILPGQTVRVRGIITGFNQDELLGSDVFLARCVLINN